MEKMYGLVGGIYSRRVKEELQQLDSSLKINRSWGEVDDLLRELATSRSFVEELDTILIIDPALESLGNDIKREKKLLTLQNELAIGNSSISLKVLTNNKNLYAQLRGKMLNVHNRLYENFEVHCPTEDLTPLIMLSFYKGDFEGTKPPSKTKPLSKIDFNREVIEKLEVTLEKVDSAIKDIGEIKESQENFMEEFRVLMSELSKKLESKTQK